MEYFVPLRHPLGALLKGMCAAEYERGQVCGGGFPFVSWLWVAVKTVCAFVHAPLLLTSLLVCC